jgi:polyisoprenoid-binding protein YceI
MPTLGPQDGTLTIRTGRKGAASKAGHDLRIEVTAWQATLDLSGSPSVTLTADSRSLKVREGTGGVKSLDDDDKASIEQTIDDEVLKGAAIEFRSTGVAVDGERVSVRGDLEIGGRSQPIAFDLLLSGGRLAGSAVVSQPAWGIKPYSALFGTLKVADEVTVSIDARIKEG